MRQLSIVSRTGLGMVAVVVSAAACPAQWVPDHLFEIRQAGFTGPEHTGSAGLQASSLAGANLNTRLLSGQSSRYIGLDTFNGSDCWVWTPTGGTVSIGLQTSAHAGSGGYRSSGIYQHDEAGEIVGVSVRVAGLDEDNGINSWVWTSTTGTVEIGLHGAAHTGSAGYQYVGLNGIVSGIYSGSSARISGVNAVIGQNTWVWTGAAGTVQTGLTGGAHTSGLGVEYSENYGLSQSGLATGISNRYGGVLGNNGQDAWVWTLSTGAVQVGLTGPGYTGTFGFQTSQPYTQNETGHVLGTSGRYEGLGNQNGTDSWAWSAADGTTVIGLTSADNIGSAGFRESTPLGQNLAGLAVGRSQRIMGVSDNNGYDAWAWSSSMGTVRLGFTDAAHTGSGGYHTSYSSTPNEAGQAIGSSTRIQGVNSYDGVDAWAWSPALGTVQVGLTDVVHTGSAGFRESYAYSQTEGGQVIGQSARVVNSSDNNGYDAWVWNAGSGTEQIGLTSPAHVGSSGTAYSYADSQLESGRVTGYSNRVSGEFDFNGVNTWVWTGATGTVQVGLTDGVHTGTGGYQEGEFRVSDNVNVLAGTSTRFKADGTTNGQNVWAWTPALGSVQTGLTDAVHTGSDGFQDSGSGFFGFIRSTGAGLLVGHSARITGESTDNGHDIWYFDPMSNTTYQPTLGVPDTVRLIDGFAQSAAGLLTEDGFLFGSYRSFPGGADLGALTRAFVYRPDLGFTDLGELVAGGLGPAGWSLLARAEFAHLFDIVAGTGFTPGQAEGSTSVFVMLVPSPSGAWIAAMGLLVFGRRRARVAA